MYGYYGNLSKAANVTAHSTSSSKQVLSKLLPSKYSKVRLKMSVMMLSHCHTMRCDLSFGIQAYPHVFCLD